jgi:hypothetical protein
MDIGHWKLKEGVNLTEDTFGFLYEIVNKITGKKYIGKKQCFVRVKKKPLKGKKRNRISQNVSDWKSYTSSSNDLNSDILKYGIENFDFFIIKTCDSKWALSYFEIKEQIDKNVLLREDYYNGIVNVRIGRPPKAELDIFQKKVNI